MNVPKTSIKFYRTAAVDGGAPCEAIRLAQYDKSMPVAAVTLTENGVKYTPPEGSLLKVRMKKPDGHSVYNNALGLWNNGEVLFLFTQQMTAAAGKKVSKCRGYSPRHRGGKMLRRDPCVCL